MNSNTSTIKNILFDLGGVIINLDYQRTIDEFSALSGFNASAIFTQEIQLQVFDSFEKGEITESEFLYQLSSLLNISDIEKITKAWNAMLLDFPLNRIHLLDKVKKNYNTFLFSNTNSIHFEAFSKILYNTHQLNSLSHLFKKDYYSHILGMRKPDPASFRFIAEEQKINPAETIFIDDSIQHIKGAQQAGLKTIWLEKNRELTELFDDFGFLKINFTE